MNKRCQSGHPQEEQQVRALQIGEQWQEVTTTCNAEYSKKHATFHPETPFIDAWEEYPSREALQADLVKRLTAAEVEDLNDSTELLDTPITAPSPPSIAADIGAQVFLFFSFNLSRASVAAMVCVSSPPSSDSATVCGCSVCS